MLTPALLARGRSFGWDVVVDHGFVVVRATDRAHEARRSRSSPPIPQSDTPQKAVMPEDLRDGTKSESSSMGSLLPRAGAMPLKNVVEDEPPAADRSPPALGAQDRWGTSSPTGAGSTPLGGHTPDAADGAATSAAVAGALGHSQPSVTDDVPSPPEDQERAPSHLHRRPTASAALGEHSNSSISGGEPGSDCDEGRAPSAGSMWHGLGQCKPCIFFAFECCMDGFDCSFCHLPHDDTKWKRSRPPQLVRKALRARLAEQSSEGASSSSRCGATKSEER